MVAAVAGIGRKVVEMVLVVVLMMRRQEMGSATVRRLEVVKHGKVHVSANGTKTIPGAVS